MLSRLSIRVLDADKHNMRRNIQEFLLSSRHTVEKSNYLYREVDGGTGKSAYHHKHQKNVAENVTYNTART